MVSAEDLAVAGYRYIGTSYKKMDCQAFIEQCLEDCGLKMDLKGSNAWYRAMTWTGTPEECAARFGGVPRGAFLFILENDGGEVKRGYMDGLGNASHIGIKTGRDDGAIHSSSTRQGVATSVFMDRTIKNGGWNRVGLWNKISYGETVNRILEAAGVDDQKTQEGNCVKIVKSENGGAVNLRRQPNGDLVDRIPCGTVVKTFETADGWTRITTPDGLTGWMMDSFLAADDKTETDGETITLQITWAQADTLISLADRIAAAFGRG